MNQTEAILRYCGIVNVGLAQQRDDSSRATTELNATGLSPDEVALLDRLDRNFHSALEPDRFVNARVTVADERFEQCFALLCATFDEAERDPLDRFYYMLRTLSDTENDHPLVLIGRFWRVPGPQEYDLAGHLQRFAFDPLTISESIVSLVSGNYMSLRAVRSGASAIGAMGHLATRERFRRGRGHGSLLVRAFEAEVDTIAQARGETLQLIALEAQADSEAFWYKQGYRWAVGTDYAQPPLEFDPATGEPQHDEVPESLMVKLVGQPAATSVDAQLLADAVRTMYQNWCLEKTRTYEWTAARRAEEYVMGEVFGRFLASLPPNGNVPLGPPPSL